MDFLNGIFEEDDLQEEKTNMRAKEFELEVMTKQSQKTEKHLRERLEKKDSQINRLQSSLKNAQQQGFTVSAVPANPELENQNRELQSENRDLQGKNRELQNRNRELQNQVAQLQRGLQNGKVKLLTVFATFVRFFLGGALEQS